MDDLKYNDTGEPVMKIIDTPYTVPEPKTELEKLEEFFKAEIHALHTRIVELEVKARGYL